MVVNYFFFNFANLLIIIRLFQLNSTKGYIARHSQLLNILQIFLFMFHHFLQIDIEAWKETVSSRQQWILHGCPTTRCRTALECLLVLLARRSK